MLKKILFLSVILFFVFSLAVWADEKDSIIEKLLVKNSELIKAIEDSNIVIAELRDRVINDEKEIKLLRSRLEDSNEVIQPYRKYELGVNAWYPTGGQILFGIFPFEKFPVSFYATVGTMTVDDKVIFPIGGGLKFLF